MIHLFFFEFCLAPRAHLWTAHLAKPGHPLSLGPCRSQAIPEQVRLSDPSPGLLRKSATRLTSLSFVAASVKRGEKPKKTAEPQLLSVARTFNREGLAQISGVAVRGSRCKKQSLGGATHRGFCFVLIIFSSRCRFRLAREPAPFRGVRSTSSGVSSQPTSINDFS